MKITGILSLLLLSARLAFAGFGEINGRVTEAATGEPIVGAYVSVEVDSNIVYQGVTDLDGYYVIKPIQNGTYDIRVSFISFSPQLFKSVTITDGQILTLNAKMKINELETVVINSGHVDLVTPGTTGNVAIISYKEIERLPLAPLDAIAITSGIYQEEPGAPIQFRGARPDATLYIIDGVKIIGDPALVRNSVEDMTVYSGGIPAKYGDATGGIVVITTKSYKKLR